MKRLSALETPEKEDRKKKKARAQRRILRLSKGCQKRRFAPDIAFKRREESWQARVLQGHRSMKRHLFPRNYQQHACSQNTIRPHDTARGMQCLDGFGPLVHRSSCIMRREGTNSQSFQGNSRTLLTDPIRELWGELVGKRCLVLTLHIWRLCVKLAPPSRSAFTEQTNRTRHSRRSGIKIHKHPLRAFGLIARPIKHIFVTK